MFIFYQINLIILPVRSVLPPFLPRSSSQSSSSQHPLYPTPTFDPQSFHSSLLFRKEQASLVFQLAMEYQVAVKLDTSFPNIHLGYIPCLSYCETHLVVRQNSSLCQCPFPIAGPESGLQKNLRNIFNCIICLINI